MDILPTEVLTTVAMAFKVFFIIIAGIIVLIGYFQAKEAHKMESKLRIVLPGSVGLAISVHLILSVIFLFIGAVFILIT